MKKILMLLVLFPCYQKLLKQLICRPNLIDSVGLRVAVFSMFGLSIMLISCERLFIEKDPENSLVENFDIFWEEFDRHYAYFELKEIDWDSVYYEYKPKVQEFTSSQQLYELLSEIVLSLKDAHVNLYARGNVVTYNFRTGYPDNSPENAANYLVNIERPNSTISYGDVASEDLGYIRIESFSIGIPGSHFEVIDEITTRFQNKRGVIIDVRSNGGGSDINSNYIASRFADQRRLYKRFRYRNGPEHTDFTEWMEDFITPEGNIFTKPVIVLTNRGSASTTEDFVLSMSEMPHVITLGTPTAGASGNPIMRELPNGWYFRLSSWMVATADFKIFEEIGLVPDFAVDLTEADATEDRDPVMEEAIYVFKNFF